MYSKGTVIRYLQIWAKAFQAAFWSFVVGAFTVQRVQAVCKTWDY